MLKNRTTKPEPHILEKYVLFETLGYSSIILETLLEIKALGAIIQLQRVLVCFKESPKIHRYIVYS